MRSLLLLENARRLMPQASAIQGGGSLLGYDAAAGYPGSAQSGLPAGRGDLGAQLMAQSVHGTASPRMDVISPNFNMSQLQVHAGGPEWLTVGWPLQSSKVPREWATWKARGNRKAVG
jgi:hypothetical protein